MQVINFTITPGILDRTVFTKNGPIVKRPQIMAQGTDLVIVSHNRIRIPSGFFDESHEGNFIRIISTPNGRNDGDFYITNVISTTELELASSQFTRVDESATLDNVCEFSNLLKGELNSHLSQDGVHATDDTLNVISSPDATDLASAVLLIDEIRLKYNNHISTIGVHTISDDVNGSFSVEPTDLNSCIQTLQELIFCYNNHRGQSKWHENRDTVNRVQSGFHIEFGGPVVGPHNWQLWDPQHGKLADDTSDVRVYVNGTPAAVEAVYGLHRAIVLVSPWSDGDEVTVDYNWVHDPPLQFAELNNWGYTLNQYQNNSYGGFLDFPVKIHSHLTVPSKKLNIGSPYKAYSAGWKYKAYERAYLSALNDPTLLLFNTPMNKIINPAVVVRVDEQSISYDPTGLPSASWQHTGSGSNEILNGSLIMSDSGYLPPPGKNTNFYSTPIQLDYPSHVFGAWRFQVLESTFDGCFSGVGFGLTDSTKLVLAGCIETEATNLSSACWLINQLKSKFNGHIQNPGVHSSNTANGLQISDAYDKNSLGLVLNSFKTAFNEHLSDEAVHKLPDIVNLLTYPQVDPEFGDLQDSIQAVNQVRMAFNSHIESQTYHFRSDSENTCGLVKQIGILKSSVLESPSSWEAFQSDWTNISTIRLERNTSGRIQLFISGDVNPMVTVEKDDLPLSSDVDIELPLFESVFFGSVGDESTSKSRWDRIRITNTPDLSHQFIRSKEVEYDATVLPQLSMQNAWTPIGLSGSSWIQSGLVVDNTAFTSEETLSDYGLSTGNYQGFVRVEPILSSDVVTVIDMTARVQSWTYSIGNRALGLFVNYKDLSVPFVFLQSDPLPGSVLGSIEEPFNILAGESIGLSVDSGPTRNITFSGPATSALDVTNEINSQFGTAIASVQGGRVKFQSTNFGPESCVSILSGTVTTKIGILPGTYFGSENNPEPRISYSGSTFPDSDTPQWVKTGSGESLMLGRNLQITDLDQNGFTCYVQSDSKLVNPILNRNADWKLNFRVRVDSHVQSSSPIISGSSLYFCGVVVSLEEESGKLVDFHLSKSSSGIPYVSIYGFNPMTSELESLAEYVFNWNDGQFHTYNLYTNKESDLVMVLADNQLLGTFNYSSLSESDGISGSIMFGTGSNDVSNGPMMSARSVSTWENVSIFRDSKVSDASSSFKRYVGIWNGKDPSKIESYSVHQIDWSSNHTYRLVIDPNNFVGVYVDGDPDPSISVPFDSLNLPETKNTFLDKVTGSRTAIAFGGFDPQQISRSVWSEVSYSCKKRGQPEDLIPPHQVLNYYNTISSPDHIFSNIQHSHYGFKISSSGVPNDEFMNNSQVASYTKLGEGIAPIPATQNLENRGGLQKIVTAIGSASLSSIFSDEGQLHTYSEDETNIAPIPFTIPDLESELVYMTNDLVAEYSTHIADIVNHASGDSFNTVSAPTATDITSCCVLLNDLKSAIIGHLSFVGHLDPDTIHTVTADDCTDYYSASVLFDDLTRTLSRHVKFGRLHKTNDDTNYSFGPQIVDLTSCIQALNALKSIYNTHRVATAQHVSSDGVNVVTATNASDFSTAVVLALDIQAKYNSHRVSAYHHSPDGANVITPSLTPGASLKQLIQFTNQAKEAFGKHTVQIPQHSTKLASGVGIWTINIITYVCSILNELKAQLNSHKDLSSVHLTTVAAPSVTAVDANNLATAIALEQDIQSVLDAHTQSNTYHKTTHSISMESTPVSTIQHLLERTNRLSEVYSDHISRIGIHGDDDYYLISYPTPTNVSEVCDILNAIKLDFNDHRTRAKIHKINDTANSVSISDAFDALSARTLSNALSNALKNHMKSQNFHNVGVTPDSIPVNDGTLERLIQVTTAIMSVYNSHGQMVVSQTRVHGNSDNVNTTQLKAPARFLAESVQELSHAYNSHVESEQVHFGTDNSCRSFPNLVYSDKFVDLNSAVRGSLDLIRRYNAHKLEWAGEDNAFRVHRNPSIVSMITEPTNLYESLTGVISMYSDYGSHMSESSIHKIGSSINSEPMNAQEPISYVNESVVKFINTMNNHVSSYEYHPEIHNKFILEDGDLTESWLVDQVNRLKSYVNLHLETTEFHAGDASSFLITMADATDLYSASVLLEDIVMAYGGHITQSGVHGNLCIIRMRAPDRVLYNAMKFFIDESGQKGQVSTIEEESDGIEFENTTTGSVTYQKI